MQHPQHPPPTLLPTTTGSSTTLHPPPPYGNIRYWMECMHGKWHVALHTVTKTPYPPEQWQTLTENDWKHTEYTHPTQKTQNHKNLSHPSTTRPLPSTDITIVTMHHVTVRPASKPQVHPQVPYLQCWPTFPAQCDGIEEKLWRLVLQLLASLLWLQWCQCHTGH